MTAPPDRRADERLGPGAHPAALETGGATLVVRTVVLPQAAAAEVERILGRVAGGARAARSARGAGQRDGVALAAAAGAA